MALGWPTPLLINSDLVTVVNPTDIVEVRCESANVDVSIKDRTASRTVKRKTHVPEQIFFMVETSLKDNISVHH
jgi:hypothetical protein